MTPSGNKNKPVTGETIMMAPAAEFYTNPELGKNQVRLAYVLCKKDLQRALMILEKALEEYRNDFSSNMIHVVITVLYHALPWYCTMWESK